jgi:hypothetical protein
MSTWFLVITHRTAVDIGVQVFVTANAFISPEDSLEWHGQI